MNDFANGFGEQVREVCRVYRTEAAFR